MCLPYMNPFRTYRLVGLGYVLGPRSELKIAGRDRTSRIIDDHAPHSPKQLVNGLQHCCISHIVLVTADRSTLSASLIVKKKSCINIIFTGPLDVSCRKCVVLYLDGRCAGTLHLACNDAITLPCLSRISLVPVGFQKVAIDTTVRARRNDFWNGVLMPTTGELAPRNLKRRALNDHELSRKRS